MGRLLIVNGSPRVPHSHSKQIAELFQTFWGGEVSKYNVTAKKHAGICEQIGTYTDLLFVFPLYVDGLPVTLMHFLKEMENHPVSPKPVVHLIINCGFLEPEQNRVACDMVHLFCKQNGYPFGNTICLFCETETQKNGHKYNDRQACATDGHYAVAEEGLSKGIDEVLDSIR